MQSHESIFTYNLTRPYPFRLYTPLVLIVFGLLLVPITFINVATAGFDLVTVTTLDPNNTVSQQSWNSWITGLSGNLHATCQPTVVSAGTQLLTNNSALTYTLTSGQNLTNLPDGDEEYFPSLSNQLTYLNNLWFSCNVNEIQVSFEAASRSPAQLSVQKQGLELSSTVFCAFESGSAVELLATYNYLPGVYPYVFPGRQNYGNTTLLLGEALLRMQWLYTAYNFYQHNMAQDPPYSKAFLNFTVQTLDGGQDSNEISSLDFFTATGSFFRTDGAAVFNTTFVESTPVSNLTGSHNATIMPGIWEAADALAKIFRDTIVADLAGVPILNANDTSQGNSLLTNATYLEQYTRNFPQMKSTLESAGAGWFDVNSCDGVPCLPVDPYTTDNLTQYELGINPSTLALSYICQVPQLKGAGSLFFSVLIADLVILQALWKLFTLIGHFVLMRRYPERFKEKDT